MMTAGFRDGWGQFPNDPIHRGAVDMMQNAADGAGRWQSAPDKRPFFAVSGTGSWAATFFVSSEGDYTTPEAAWALVQQLDDDTADTLDIALCQWLANRDRDPSGLVYMTAIDILAQKGRAKEPHGGYKTDDKRAAAQHMQALAALEVEGRNFERYEPGKGKGRSKKVTISPVGKLIEISVREELKRLDGTRGATVGWFYRVGAWSVAFQHDPRRPRYSPACRRKSSPTTVIRGRTRSAWAATLPGIPNASLRAKLRPALDRRQLACRGWYPAP